MSDWNPGLFQDTAKTEACRSLLEAGVDMSPASILVRLACWLRPEGLKTPVGLFPGFSKMGRRISLLAPWSCSTACGLRLRGWNQVWDPFEDLCEGRWIVSCKNFHLCFWLEYCFRHWKQNTTCFSKLSNFFWVKFHLNLHLDYSSMLLRYKDITLRIFHYKERKEPVQKVRLHTDEKKKTTTYRYLRAAITGSVRTKLKNKR